MDGLEKMISGRSNFTGPCTIFALGSKTCLDFLCEACLYEFLKPDYPNSLNCTNFVVHDGGCTTMSFRCINLIFLSICV